jgi:hypothetical protein
VTVAEFIERSHRFANSGVPFSQFIQNQQEASDALTIPASEAVRRILNSPFIRAGR